MFPLSPPFVLSLQLDSIENALKNSYILDASSFYPYILFTGSGGPTASLVLESDHFPPRLHSGPNHFSSKWATTSKWLYDISLISLNILYPPARVILLKHTEPDHHLAKTLPSSPEPVGEARFLAEAKRGLLQAPSYPSSVFFPPLPSLRTSPHKFPTSCFDYHWFLYPCFSSMLNFIL